MREYQACHQRPRYKEGAKIHEYCGKACAAKVKAVHNAPAASGMCKVNRVEYFVNYTIDFIDLLRRCVRLSLCIRTGARLLHFAERPVRGTHVKYVVT